PRTAAARADAGAPAARDSGASLVEELPTSASAGTTRVGDPGAAERPGRGGTADGPQPGRPAAPRPAGGGQQRPRTVSVARSPLPPDAAGGGRQPAGAVGGTGRRLRRGRQPRRRGPLLAQRPV